MGENGVGFTQCWRMEENMSDGRLIGLAAGLLSLCGMTADGYAAA